MTSDDAPRDERAEESDPQTGRGTAAPAVEQGRGDERAGEVDPQTGRGIVAPAVEEGRGDARAGEVDPQAGRGAATPAVEQRRGDERARRRARAEDASDPRPRGRTHRDAAGRREPFADSAAALTTVRTAALTTAVREAVAAVRAAGRTTLLEHEGLALAAALGLDVPRHVLLPAAAPGDAPGDGLDRAAWERVPGERLVLKVLAADLPHRSDVGGVRVVSRAEVPAALDELADRFRDHELVGVLVEEHVPHDVAPGGELLLGFRATDDFGPVVTVALGGVHAERLSALLPDDRAAAIVSPALVDDAILERALDRAAVTELATRSQRGCPARLDRERFDDLLRGWSRLAEVAVAEGLVEFELNPLALVDGRPVVLDALGHLGRPPAAPAAPRPLARLDALLRPRSLALVGVSAQHAGPGRIILDNLLEAGFPPEHVVVVKPGAERVAGCRCVPDLDALDGPVDLLVVAIAAGAAAEITARALRERKAASVILIPGGFDEHEDGTGHARRITEAVAEARSQPDGGGVVNGGNCLGVRSVPGRYDTLFIPRHKLAFDGGRPAPLAVVSQSGAFAVSWASRLGSLAPRTVITVGNQIDLTVADHLEHLAKDPAVRVLAAYVEGFRPGDGLRVARLSASLAAEGRPLVIYRAGRTSEGRAASASHTASLAGDARVGRALLESAGALIADDLDDFTDLTRTACALVDKPVHGLALGAVSNAGFECVTVADRLGPFHLPELGASTRERLAALLSDARLSAVVGVRNPLDVTPIVDDEGLVEALRIVLDDRAVDVGLLGCVPLSGAITTLAAGTGHAEDLAAPTSVACRLIELQRRSPRPWVAVVDAGPLYDPLAAALEAGGIPTFRRADRALRTFGQWCTWKVQHLAAART